MALAQRLAQITPSLTLSIDTTAKTMQAQGIPVCSFSTGEPDFDTPAHICQAAKLALDQGKTRYTAAAGIKELREAIAHKLQTENQLPYSPEQIVVTNGGKHSLYNLMMVLLNAGDEVIIPAPYWLSYPEMVKLAEAVPVIVPTTPATNYKITPAQLSASITPRTRLFVLNSPSNPTGMVYSPAEIHALAEVLAEHPQVYILTDEIYEKLVYDSARHFSIGAVSPEIFQRTILSSGFAKAYAMTGWRIGYLAAPLEIARAAITLQGHSTSNVCTFAQYGAIAALTASQECVEQMRQAFQARRDLMYSKIATIPRLSCAKPEGAFYLFPDISQTGLSSHEFAEKLLKAYQVAVVPGIAFGADHNIRLSYATDVKTIMEGCDRLAQFVHSLP
ncbi:MAG: pyridoxal phosphate-dependent aminotransferase [Pseudanabaenaceae cyanobacterium]